MTRDEQDEYARQWHLDKKVPIAFILAILLQTGSFIWWAAKNEARLDILEKQMLALSPHADRITRMEVQVQNIEKGIMRIENVLHSRTPTSFAPAGR